MRTLKLHTNHLLNSTSSLLSWSPVATIDTVNAMPTCADNRFDNIFGGLYSQEQGKYKTKRIRGSEEII